MVNLGKTIANDGRVEMSLTLKNCNVLESIIYIYIYSFLIGSVVRGFDHLLVDCYWCNLEAHQKNTRTETCA